MSKFKRHLKAGLLLVVAAAFALSCARSSKTKFAQNMENDAGKPAPTYDEWVSLVGQTKADQLYAGIGQDSLNLLSYGIGISNLAPLINGITDGSKFVDLVGNDNIAGQGTGAATGLGSVVTLYLLKSVDTQMQANISTNLNGGGVAPADNDTITNLVNVLNGLSGGPTGEIQQKLIELFGPQGFDLSRSLAVATSLSAADQKLIVDRMARIVAHVDNTSPACNKLCTLLTNLTAAEIRGPTGKLAAMLKYKPALGMGLADKLVETIERTSLTMNLVQVIQGVTYANTTGKMMPIIEQVGDCTKMGYVIDNVTALTTLISLINYVQVPDNMGKLINLAENNGTWAGQVSPAEAWGVGPGPNPKGNPFSTAPTAANITGNISGGALLSITVNSGGSNYLPGISLSFPSCSPQPTIHLNVQGGVIQNSGHYIINAGASCANGATQTATVLTAGTKTAMQRLVDVINNINDSAADQDAAQDFYKLLTLIDSLSPTQGMDKMIRLVQDVQNIGDVYDLVNNMGSLAGTGCTVGNGNDTMTISGGGGSSATATVYNVTATAGPTNSVAYVYVSNGGSGYTSQPTMTVPGCAGVTFTATISGGVITQITANNPMNNLAQVMELMTLANMPKLQQVLDGQRAFDNTNQTLQGPAATAGTYLYKMSVLMQNLNQGLEGPLKVGDLLNGVTNSDKIIDLIWGVSNTSYLSDVINGIFKSSEVPGCSDGSASDADGTSATPASGAAYQYNLGAGNTTASDAGTCEASGNGAFWGERDRAVTTLVYLVENVASSAKLISMIDNIQPTSKVVALINHTSTYNQHADGTAHVYPRGAVGIDAQAAGKRLAKIVDNTTTITQLNFVANNVTAIIKMAKLVSFMDFGSMPVSPSTDGAAKLAVLINAVGGTNCYLGTTVPGRGNTTAVAPGGSAACVTQNSTNATGMGKMVNVIEFVTGATASSAMVQLKDLMNNVGDINKMADLINQTVNSSNIVGLLNGVIDPRNNTSTAALVSLMNNMPRGEITKLVSLVGEIGNATGTATDTFPGADHKLIAQLMANYSAANVATTSGVGVTTMSQLMGLLGVYPCPVGPCTSTIGIRGGRNFTTSVGLNVNLVGLGSGAGATASAIIQANTGTVTRIILSDEGRCTVAPTTATITSVPAGTGASATVVAGPHAQYPGEFKVKGVYLNNGGSGYVAPTISFNGSCGATPPVATLQVDGLAGISVTAGGSGYTDGFNVPAANITGGGGISEQARALVAGPINSLAGFNGGKGYNTGNVCPIIGAGGSGGTCTVTASPAVNGAITGCSAISGGNGYIDGQVVTIGGGAVIRANVDGLGNISGFAIVNPGCGYTVAPIVSIATGANECGAAVNPTVTLDVNGGISGFVGGSGSGCPKNPTITVGAVPYAVHADNGTAIVNNVTNGSVVAISLAPAADNLAQMLANTEKSPDTAAINYNGSATPNISAREAMVRLLFHGANHTSTGYLAVNGGGNGVVNNVDYPGIGAAHLGQNVLANLTGTYSTMTVINMLNSDSTSMTDLVTLLGCGDAIEFSKDPTLANWSTTSFKYFCSLHNPNMWLGP